jgi:peptidoglycan/LPS O-acetylase OafA/YrhL
MPDATSTTELPVASRPEHRGPLDSSRGGRLPGLDGVRGLAALYVVMHHIFLRAFPGYPANHAPFWAAWLIYGRFAVVVFIVLSGFSLAAAPARHGWRLDGVRSFARRRAWRILPPYWIALLFSLSMTWFVAAQPGLPRPDGKSVLVNGLLVQDVFGAAIPNRAFWSIAIEAQLYIAFPLLILLVRKWNAVSMLAVTAAAVVSFGLLAPYSQTTGRLLLTLNPDLAVLFAIGVAAAGVVTAGNRIRALPWSWLALLLIAPVLAVIAWRGSVWTIGNLFWVDLALGPAIGCALIAIATSRPRALTRLLDTRPLRSLGSFSYSLYLTHAPIVIAVWYGLLASHIAPGPVAFIVLAVIATPLALGFARLFATVFELPFQRRRGPDALRAAFAGAGRFARGALDRRLRPVGAEDRLVIPSQTTGSPQPSVSD